MARWADSTVHRWLFLAWARLWPQPDPEEQRWDVDEKVTATRWRDAANGSLLRERDWKVIRTWECQLKAGPDACVKRISSALKV